MTYLPATAPLSTFKKVLLGLRARAARRDRACVPGSAAST